MTSKKKSDPISVRESQISLRLRSMIQCVLNSVHETFLLFLITTEDFSIAPNVDYVLTIHYLMFPCEHLRVTSIILYNSIPPAANLNTYVISYIRQHNPTISYKDWMWLSSTKTVLTGVLMPFGGEISRRVGVKFSLLLGSVIYR